MPYWLQIGWRGLRDQWNCGAAESQTPWVRDGASATSSNETFAWARLSRQEQQHPRRSGEVLGNEENASVVVNGCRLLTSCQGDGADSAQLLSLMLVICHNGVVLDSLAPTEGGAVANDFCCLEIFFRRNVSHFLFCFVWNLSFKWMRQVNGFRNAPSLLRNLLIVNLPKCF